ncbi:YciI family protein [Amycolatopsis sp. cg5]|uniref:YciI family protein n=1 Tax=Amycolatopsis sp. cg5 TaxID=3238802 RepID=UPI003525EE3F
MKYVLLICGDETTTETGCGGWSDEMAERGVLVQAGVGLRPPSDATTVRVRDEAVMLSDGPFAETKEQIGGFCVIECADLDEAIEITAKHPMAACGAIEIRPLWQP